MPSRFGRGRKRGKKSIRHKPQNKNVSNSDLSEPIRLQQENLSIEDEVLRKESVEKKPIVPIRETMSIESEFKKQLVINDVKEEKIPTPLPINKTIDTHIRPTKEPVINEVKPSKDSVNSESTNKILVLNILERLVKCLQTNKEKDISILKSFLYMIESNDERKKPRYELISTVLTYTENSKLVEIENLSAKFEKMMLPGKLSSLVLDKNSVKLIDTIGEGSFGTIYLGQLVKDNITVAVKVTNINDRLHIEENDVFRNEAHIMSNLNHPNIVKILGIIITPYRIVMEFIEKGNLYDLLKTRRYDNNKILKAILDITTGMEYLSEKNIIHRDLSLANIFVDEDDNCKIGDFGISCYADSKKKLNMVTGHAAPEILTAKMYSTKSDIYSMGFLIWEGFMVARQHEEYRKLSFFANLHMVNARRFMLNLFHEHGDLFKPKTMPKELYMLTRTQLLNKNPSKRPTFTDIKKVILCLLN